MQCIPPEQAVNWAQILLAGGFARGREIVKNVKLVQRTWEEGCGYPTHRGPDPPGPWRCYESGPMRKSLMGAMLAMGVAAWTGVGCEETPKARRVDPVVRDIPAVLRGTVGSEVSIRGIDPILVSGFGIVVGLNGTGGGPLPVQIQATMERELARGGIGRGGPLRDGPLAGKTPREVLRDPAVAVVIVEGVIPPGSPKGSTFDVRVRTLPGSNVSSLEGGLLWTTDLRLGPVTPFGAMRTRNIATAKGALFINPFAEPGAGASLRMTPTAAEREEQSAAAAAPREELGLGESEPERPLAPPVEAFGDGVTRNVGRVLDGGLVTDPLAVELILDNPSHSRATSITQALNSRFPPGVADEGPTARGRSNASIAVRVPQAWKTRAAEFLQILRFTQIDQSFPQEYARRYTEELKKQPALSDELAWCLQALGKPAVPFLAPLYDFPEFLPRMAAIRTGARLDDPRVTPYLKELASSSSPGLRSEAIELLGEMAPDPKINLALRELLDAPELDVRVAAYEALAARADSSVERAWMGGKFYLDTVPAKEELIYISQQGEPRVVLFGNDMRLRRDLLVSAWSDRLLLKAEDSPTATSGVARLFYRDYRTKRAVQIKLDGPVRNLVRVMAQTTTDDQPEPGLGLTYSEVVGGLYEIQRQGGIGGAFATERDRLLARLLEAQDLTLIEERPESGDRPVDKMEARMKPVPKPVGPVEKRSLVVPLSPAKKKE